jgi:hypothetical protein
MRHHLFTGQNYYPSAGLDDYSGSFDTFDEAVAEGKDKCAKRPEGHEGYWHSNDWWVVIVEEDGDLVEIASGH